MVKVWIIQHAASYRSLGYVANATHLLNYYYRLLCKKEEEDGIAAGGERTSGLAGLKAVAEMLHEQTKRLKHLADGWMDHERRILSLS